MLVKKIKPITPGQRFRIAPDFSILDKVKPEKSLLAPVKSTGGRNNRGKMTVQYRGGGHKRCMRIIDFKRNKHNIPAKVHSIQYDPMRTAYIALLHYSDGEKSYIIAPKGLKAGDQVISGINIAPEVGNAMPLNNMPAGTIVHNVELQPGRGASMARSAGAYAELVAKGEKYAILKLPSGAKRMVLGRCMATVGSVSNEDHMKIVIAKAGRNRWLGRRPRTRKVAMNPVDHPMGGGEGKASGGQPRSKKGLYAKGKKTRNRNKYSNQYIIVNKKR